jgi:hypothetical protein
MIGINTEEKLVTVATFDLTHFQVGDYINFTDSLYGLQGETVVGIIEAINADAMTLTTVKGIRYTVTASNVNVGNYIVEKVTITVEGGI